jgi:hypothetical protein
VPEVAVFFVADVVGRVCAVLLLGSLLYRSGLVPRVIPAMGLIGAPLLISSALGQIFGINEPISVWSGIAVLPIFLFELSLGLYLVIRGFRPSAMAALATESRGTDEPAAPAQSPTVVATKAGAA